MSKKTPLVDTSRRAYTLVLPVSAFIALAGCAAPKPQPVTSLARIPAAPTITGIVIAIRAESSVSDPSGALQQIMLILGQSALPSATADQIVLRMPGNVIKTSVQSMTNALAVGEQAAVFTVPTTTISPD